jgi:hypothetical protein
VHQTTHVARDDEIRIHFGKVLELQAAHG